MRIETLRAFIKILEMESFTAAADELFMTQSALSKQITELERAMGQPLLRRTTRSVSATEAGLALKTHALRILEEWDLTLKDMSRRQACTKASIHMGYTTSEQLPFILAGVNRKAWKKLEIELTLSRESPDQIIQALREGRIDCAVMHRPTMQSGEGMHADCLAHTAIQARICRSSPLAERQSLTLREVGEQIEVRCNRSRDPLYYNAIDQAFVDADLKIPRHIETAQSEEVDVLAARPGYMSLCPSIYPTPAGFVAIPIVDCMADFDFLFVRCQGNLRPELDWLYASIREAMKRYL